MHHWQRLFYYYQMWDFLAFSKLATPQNTYLQLSAIMSPSLSSVQAPPSERVQYTAWDLSRHAKADSRHLLRNLQGVLAPLLRATGLFVSRSKGGGGGECLGQAVAASTSGGRCHDAGWLCSDTASSKGGPAPQRHGSDHMAYQCATRIRTLRG